MKWALFVFIVVAAALVDVISVSPENSSVLEKGEWLIFFSLSSCPHCKALIPAWLDLASQLSPDDTARLAHVDCGSHKGSALCEGLTSFPALVWRSSGAASKPYHGARDAVSLGLFIAKQTGPAVRQGGEWIKRDVEGTVVVQSASCSGEAVKQFERAAGALRERFFFVVVETEGNGCRIDVVRLGGKEWARWNLEGNLTAFIEREATPLVSPFRKFVHATSKRPVVHLFHEGAAPSDNVLDEVRAASQILRNAGTASVLFAHVSTSEWDGVRAGAHAPYPSIVLVDTARLNHHYVYSSDVVRAAELADWVRMFLDGRLKRTLVSEAESPERLPNSARRLVGSNWEREVLQDDGRDVLVFFWSPHCGSSVGARPMWEEVMQALSARSESRLLLAEADGWANDWSGIELSGLPDIRLFHADNKNASKRFSGPRSAPELLEWLQQLAFNELPLSVAKDEL
jgi:thioredoxin-like negative regulator of GroEL